MYILCNDTWMYTFMYRLHWCSDVGLLYAARLQCAACASLHFSLKKKCFANEYWPCVIPATYVFYWDCENFIFRQTNPLSMALIQQKKTFVNHYSRQILICQTSPRILYKALFKVYRDIEVLIYFRGIRQKGL